MFAFSGLSAAALLAGVLALAQGAAAQVKIGGKEAMLSNQSTYRPSLGDLPAPPAIAAPKTSVPKTAAPKLGAGAYCNSFTCIPDSAGAAPPAGAKRGTSKIGQFAIHGNSPAPPQRARSMQPRR